MRLHQPDQGPGQREVLRALRGLRSGARGHAHRRCQHQPRCADHLLHGRDPLQHGLARRCGSSAALCGHGRVPLLLRSGPRRGLADPADHHAGHAVPPDERHAGRYLGHPPAPGRRHRPRRGRDRNGRAAGSAGLQLPRQPLADHRAGSPGPRTGADLHRQLHPARMRRVGPIAAQHRRLLRGREEGPGQGPARRGLLLALWQGDPALPARRHRGPPRGPPASLPPAGRAVGPAGPAQGDLRHGYAGRGGEHPHPHGALQQAGQV